MAVAEFRELGFMVRSKGDKINNIGKGALFFGFIGPPMGGLPFVIAAAVEDYSNPENFIMYFMFINIFSYMFGGIPALATGVIAGAFRKKLSQFSYCCFIGICGWFFTMIANMLMIRDSLSSAMIIGILGLVPGMLCAYFFHLPGGQT